MGQYYTAINFDKKQKVLAWDYGSGLKLMEFSWQGNIFIRAVESLLNNEWKGDRVVFVGNYAESYITDEAEFDYVPYLTSLAEEFGTKDLYSIDAERLVSISPPDSLRYIINDKDRMYIDRKEQPIQWTYESENKVAFAKIDPLSLVLAVGNGLGGGDYYGYDANLVGIWAASSLRTDSNIPEGYSKADIVFDEQREFDFGYYKDINGKNLEIMKEKLSGGIKKITNDYVLFLDEEELKVIEPSEAEKLKAKLTLETEKEKNRFLRKTKKDMVKECRTYAAEETIASVLQNMLATEEDAERVKKLMEKPNYLSNLAAEYASKHLADSVTEFLNSKK